MIGPFISSAKAPIADIYTGSGDALLDIYSMFRLRKGYAGPCRRVVRALDGASQDFYFTPGGLYPIAAELAWAQGTNTHVTRWYNQSSSAGSGRPSYLEFTGTYTDAPYGSITGAAQKHRGYPAIYFDGTSELRPQGNIAIGYSTYITSVWCGRFQVSFTDADQTAWYLCTDRSFGGSYLYGNNRAHLYDAGPYYEAGGHKIIVKPSGEFSDAAGALIVATHREGQDSTAHVNGASISLGAQNKYTWEPAASVLTGPSIVHTFIVDGNADLAVKNLANSSAFNKFNWAY